MATARKNLSEFNPKQLSLSKSVKIGIVVSEWNHDITDLLYEGCIRTLEQFRLSKNNIVIIKVPGSFELTAGANMLINKYKKLNAIICLGCIIKGETKHDEYIASAIANGLTALNLKFNVPFVFGVLTTNNLQQAKDRAGGKHGNKGVEAAVTAVKMITLHRS